MRRFAWRMALCGVSVMILGCSSEGRTPVNTSPEAGTAEEKSLDDEGGVEEEAFKTGKAPEAPDSNSEEKAEGSPRPTSDDQEFKTGDPGAAG